MTDDGNNTTAIAQWGSPSNLVVYGIFIGEGALMTVGNVAIVLAILCFKPMRRKELLLLAGLSTGDVLYGKYNTNYCIFYILCYSCCYECNSRILKRLAVLRR